MAPQQQKQQSASTAFQPYSDNRMNENLQRFLSHQESEQQRLNLQQLRQRQQLHNRHNQFNNSVQQQMLQHQLESDCLPQLLQ